MISSYSTTLLEYNIHVLKTHIGHFGVAEGLLGGMVLLLLAMIIDTEAPILPFLPSFLNFQFIVVVFYLQK